MLYVEIDVAGNARHLHYAPYLDYRPIKPGEPGVDAILQRPEAEWISRELEQKAQGHAVATVVPEHLQEVRSRKLELISKTEAAVKGGANWIDLCDDGPTCQGTSMPPRTTGGRGEI
jgi:hypothetical protein